ncbi:MAG: carbamoyltransferase HypF, partial [Bryobacteraceae bacterium]
MTAARSIRVRGVVQGVGFRPFVYRLATASHLAGWVLNEAEGVDIHLEGSEPELETFVHDLRAQAPAAACITEIHVHASEPSGFQEFTIRESRCEAHPTAGISPDLPVCGDCLRELFDPTDPRYLYPYINCTNCGPRYTVIECLPYDRRNTTMKAWRLDHLCAEQYHDPADRRFHAQPVACSNCGPRYAPSIEEIAGRLQRGQIVAIKGIGGYHLACDARNAEAVRELRERKYRKEKPFAIMARNIALAREIVDLSPDAEVLLASTARPIVLAPARMALPGVAPDNHELGVMLPYAPLHYLLFAAGAPQLLVMTSANRSSEPIAYEDRDARERLAGIADAFLTGERPIARRVDDSVARVGPFGPVILRRSRGYAPGAVVVLPVERPVLAVGADLKNTITLTVHGQAFMSQHIGDLDHFQAQQSFERTIEDLVAMYEVDWKDVLVVHDLHPQYSSTLRALELPAHDKVAVQHHRAHIASVLAERGAWDTRVIGVSFDGAGYGDDGTIWGGEFFTGSLREGFHRAMHLRKALLPGGDAAAKYPVQCAAGFLSQVDGVPIELPERYHQSLRLIERGVRTFETTSIGRLFDTVAALLGFTREISFEGQAAMWVEHLARSARGSSVYLFPVQDGELDFRPLLLAIAEDRTRGRDVGEIALAFHRSVAKGLSDAVEKLRGETGIEKVVLSGGVFQNDLLVGLVKELLEAAGIEIWTNAAVPPNDGGISLGQA